jgi:hypothetical protein
MDKNNRVLKHPRVVRVLALKVQGQPKQVGAQFGPADFLVVLRATEAGQDGDGPAPQLADGPKTIEKESEWGGKFPIGIIKINRQFITALTGVFIPGYVRGD